MKPLHHQPTYPGLLKTAKVYMLLLSGGIALSVLIILLQVFSFYSQANNAGNNQPSKTPKPNPVIAVAATMLLPEVLKEAPKKEEPKKETIALITDSAAAPATNIVAPVVLKAVKTASELKADRAFIRENKSRNAELIKELSAVIEMHEFHFKKSSSQLSHLNGMEKFDSSVQKCIETPESWSKIIILGFTDNRGSKLVNIKLGMKRANILKNMLVKRGIPAEKITIASFGPELPIGSNNTPEGRAENRRVEFNLVGAGS